MIIRNKKGGEELITPWLFLIFALISGVIFLAVIFYYSASADIRNLEAEFLNLKIIECLKENDFLDKSFYLFDSCKLNREIIENSGNYYLYLNIDGKEEEYGVQGFKVLCGLEDKSENFPKCSLNKLNIKNSKVEILTASNQEGKKL